MVALAWNPLAVEFISCKTPPGLTAPAGFMAPGLSCPPGLVLKQKVRFAENLDDEEELEEQVSRRAGPLGMFTPACPPGVFTPAGPPGTFSPATPPGVLSTYTSPPGLCKPSTDVDGDSDADSEIVEIIDLDSDSEPVEIIDISEPATEVQPPNLNVQSLEEEVAALKLQQGQLLRAVAAQSLEEQVAALKLQQGRLLRAVAAQSSRNKATQAANAAAAREQTSTEVSSRQPALPKSNTSLKASSVAFQLASASHGEQTFTTLDTKQWDSLSENDVSTDAESDSENSLDGSFSN